MKNRIRQCRETAGLTLKQLAAISGVSFQAIQALETGTRGETSGPGVLTIEKLADALGVIPAYLVGWSDEPLCQVYERQVKPLESEIHLYHVHSQHLTVDAVVAAKTSQQAVSVALRHCYDWLPEKIEKVFKRDLIAEEIQAEESDWPRWIAGREK